MISRTSLILMCFLLGACDDSTESKSKSAEKVQVGVYVTKYQPVTLSISLPGRTTSVKAAEVRPQVSGVILKRLFKEGSDVKAGQQLYQIDPATYEAAYDKAKAQLVNAEYIYNRDKILLKGNAVSKQSYDTAFSDYLQAKADLKTAQVNLNYTKVLAPISGRIGRSSVTEGALVSDGQTTALATITQLDPMYVDVNQSSDDLLALRQAIQQGHLDKVNSTQEPVSLTLEGGQVYSQPGTLEFSEVQVDESTGSVTIRARFPNPQAELLPGMFVHEEINQGVVINGIRVPQKAVLHNTKGKPYVYLVGKDNKVVQQNIVTGQMKDGYWQVSSGLKENEQVIISGIQNISTGTQVTIHQDDNDTNNENKSDVQLSMTDPSAQ